jgi:ketosteroid isomerase-like protein
MKPEELEELVRLNAEGYNRRDPEAMIDHWDPECEWHPFITAELEGAEGYRGREGVRKWFRDTDEMFSKVQWRVEEVRDLGDDRVLILGELEARGRASGVDVTSPLGQVFELREGRILRGWAYPSHEQAEQAAELRSRERT